MKRALFCKHKRAAAPIITILTAFAFALFLSGAAYAQERQNQPDQIQMDRSEYEYEYYEGLHQEEWYDPSDWFDEEGEGISYETDWYDYTYGYGDYYDEDIYGYYGDDFYDEDYYDFGYEDFDDYDYDYYTDDWYEDDEIF